MHSQLSFRVPTFKIRSHPASAGADFRCGKFVEVALRIRCDAADLRSKFSGDLTVRSEPLCDVLFAPSLFHAWRVNPQHAPCVFVDAVLNVFHLPVVVLYSHLEGLVIATSFDS